MHTFVYDYSRVAAPVNQLTSLKVPFVWSDVVDETFCKLFVATPVLSPPDPSHQLVVEVDASDTIKPFYFIFTVPLKSQELITLKRKSISARSCYETIIILLTPSHSLNTQNIQLAMAKKETLTCSSSVTHNWISI